MTREFKVGDEIIMEVHYDGGRGCPDKGIYKGIVTQINEEEIATRIEGLHIAWTFNPISLENIDWGAQITIRHADEVSATIKQEWVKGQANKGYHWFYNPNLPESGVRLIRVDGVIGRDCYYMPAELPPPPPIEEVEAYGMLEAVDKFIIAHNKNALQDKNNREESLARALSIGIMHLKAFFSLPATAENFSKYFRIAGAGVIYDWEAEMHNMTLDHLILWINIKYKRQLFFTAAALKELGVK